MNPTPSSNQRELRSGKDDFLFVERIGRTRAWIFFSGGEIKHDSPNPNTNSAVRISRKRAPEYMVTADPRIVAGTPTPILHETTCQSTSLCFQYCAEAINVPGIVAGSGEATAMKPGKPTMARRGVAIALPPLPNRPPRKPDNDSNDERPRNAASFRLFRKCKVEICSARRRGKVQPGFAGCASISRQSFKLSKILNVEQKERAQHRDHETVDALKAARFCVNGNLCAEVGKGARSRAR